MLPVESDIETLMKFAHSPVMNYVIPGLNSYLLSDLGARGKIRMFECTRNHEEQITPHSHRFDFSACVLTGEVTNILWYEAHPHPVKGWEESDQFVRQTTLYSGEIGRFKELEVSKPSMWVKNINPHRAGEWYRMTHKQIHSIRFKKGTRVIFFEGPQITDRSEVLLPFVNGEVIPTMKTEPWMFKGALSEDRGVRS